MCLKAETPVLSNILYTEEQNIKKFSFLERSGCEAFLVPMGISPGDKIVFILFCKIKKDIKTVLFCDVYDKSSVHL